MHGDTTDTDDLADWWDALRAHASCALHEGVYDGLDVWPNDDENKEIPWEVTWRGMVEALELLAIAEIADVGIWMDALMDILSGPVRFPRPPRWLNSHDDAMARLCREHMVIVTTSRAKNNESHVHGHIGDVLHALLRPRDKWSTAPPGDKYPALRAKLVELCGESERQRKRSEELIVPVGFRRELHSSLPSVTPFERIRKVHCAMLFEPPSPSLGRTECPFRLVDLSVDIVADGQQNQEELRFQLSELRQNEDVTIQRLEIKGFHEDVTVAMRREWLETIFAPIRRPIDRFYPYGLEGSTGEVAAIASSLMHARHIKTLHLGDDWRQDGAWPLALYALFSASATHSISELHVDTLLIWELANEFDDLTAARNPRAMLLSEYPTMREDIRASCAPMRAIVEDGVVLDA